MAKKIVANAVADGAVGSAIKQDVKNNYTPSSSTQSNSNLTLRTGSTGTDVKKLQVALGDAGYYVGAAGADGIYGKDTAAAVKQYQKDNGLTIDGIAGTNTLGSLYGTTTTPASTTDTAKEAAKVPQTTPAASPTDMESFTYDPFTYDDYAESDTVTQANTLLQQHRENKPGAYQSQWQGQIDEAFDAYFNRDPFSYDFNSDALYQQYKDNYIQQGQMAMMDTMGQAAAMTGGYGNSYAQTVGQQAYNQQLSQLNDIMPELYQMAYDQYDRKGTELYNQYNMLLARENKDYSRYPDDLSNWYKDLDDLTNTYNTERERDYNLYKEGKDIAREDYLSDKNVAYNEYSTEQDRKWDEYLAQQDRDQSAAELMAGLGNYDRLGEMYGLTDEEIAQIKEANTPKVSYSGGSTTPTYTEMSRDDKSALIKIFQGAETTEQLGQLAMIYGEGYDPDDINSLLMYAGGDLYNSGSQSTDTTVDELDKLKKGKGGGGGGGVMYHEVK